jgi:choline dehydrogenase-like flavoprotein
MEIDLQRAETPTQAFRSQVCIVGAGIAGLTLAHKLSQKGIDVALLEAGGQSLTAHGEELFRAAHLAGLRHNGTVEGRFRVFGGSSLRWGGQLLPFPEDAGWPVSFTELAPFQREAEKLLAVDNLPYDVHELFQSIRKPVPRIFDQLPNLAADLSKWMPFSQRNLAATLGSGLLDNPRALVYLNVQVTELLLDSSGAHVDAVLARSPRGTAFRFEADQFVVAAGTVETSRLLLASRSVSLAGVGNRHDQVGRNFHDHLTLSAATVTGTSREVLLRDLRPWHLGKTLHSIKLAASADLRKQLALNPVLAHITLEEPEDSGAGVIRQMLLAKQTGASRFSLLPKLPSAAIEALRMLWSAKGLHRRFVSAAARVQIYLNAAQDAPSSSRITLASELDPAGMPQASVDWGVTENEIATLRKFAVHLRNRLDSISLCEGIAWNSDLFTPNVPLRGLDDARHAMGGACMGDDPRTSVVDSNLTVHGVANLHIASAAVFPDGSPQLPTLPLLAMTLRLADYLVGKLRK